MTGAEQAEQEQRWATWVQSASSTLGVDPAAVDVPAIHHLSKQVARRLERPLVPVSAFLLGLAVGGSHSDGPAAPVSADDAFARLLAILPPEAEDLAP